ncbi:MAG: DUF4442 domain-containing protein [Gammaproteobacteria bacterium]|nr:DUF4442 domain-containing protein [Gammaproteobacteria bacterium]
MKPKALKLLLNLYPPYIGAGIKVEYIAENWQETRVSLKKRWYNKNAVGTHFGGNLYSMTDPHLMLMLMQILGKQYYVWDKTASIEFIKASRKKVTATFQITDDQLEEIKAKTAKGEKYLPEFEIDLIDEEQNLIARVHKTIYIKKKPDLK